MFHCVYHLFAYLLLFCAVIYCFQYFHQLFKSFFMLYLIYLEATDLFIYYLFNNCILCILSKSVTTSMVAPVRMFLLFCCILTSLFLLFSGQFSVLNQLLYPPFLQIYFYFPSIFLLLLNISIWKRGVNSECGYSHGLFDLKLSHVMWLT